LDLYLTEIAKRRIEPNFWCSREYLRTIRAEERLHGSKVWLVDFEGEILFPVIDTETEEGLTAWTPDDRPVWSDFRWPRPFDFSPGWVPEKLDREFIYNPIKFLDLSGGCWKVFRKNVRKWPRRTKDKGGLPHYLRIGPGESTRGIELLLLSWIEDIGEKKIHDSSALVELCLKANNRAVLYIEHSRGRLLAGLNVWDYSPGGRANFRYSIARPHQPFLSDYLRLQFYPDPRVWSVTREVNDGGCLDCPGLEAYKLKLNPISTRWVRSWSKEKNNEG